MNRTNLPKARKTVRAHAGAMCHECGERTVIVSCARPECGGASILCSGCYGTLERYVWDDGLCAHCGATRV